MTANCNRRSKKLCTASYKLATQLATLLASLLATLLSTLLAELLAKLLAVPAEHALRSAGGAPACKRVGECAGRDDGRGDEHAHGRHCAGCSGELLRVDGTGVQRRGRRRDRWRV